ncbi:MAG: hypothetical protein CM1200mP29_08470 [Verrucomicrobiota bacterium]|nr:MAG: hypothetical protein CM1200mP29_08470 [Verrucomicrobiota bacterium]
MIGLISRGRAAWLTSTTLSRNNGFTSETDPKKKKSPLNEWRKYIENPLEPIDEKLIENIRSRFAAAREGDSLHSLIHGKKGPLQNAKGFEKLFTKETGGT